MECWGLGGLKKTWNSNEHFDFLDASVFGRKNFGLIVVGFIFSTKK